MSDFCESSDDAPPAPEMHDSAAPVEPAEEADLAGDPEIGGDGWSGADIEEAYLKALSAIEDAFPEAVPPAPADEPPPAAQALVETAAPPAALDASAAGSSIVSDVAPVAETSAPGVPAAPPAAGPRLARGTERPARQDESEPASNVSPAQVIEAALFVGGGPLTARKLCALLRGSFDAAFIEQTVDDLNSTYAAQARPYEIRLGDGGYRLELRAEYDRLRHRVYGSGPREVRLTQDVLEVLALVAYRQPISQPEIESHGKQNAGNLLRQLLRRDLVAFERGPGGRKDLRYHTTPRFLSVFGLAGLEDLPQAEDLAKK